MATAICLFRARSHVCSTTWRVLLVFALRDPRPTSWHVDALGQQGSLNRSHVTLTSEVLPICAFPQLLDNPQSMRHGRTVSINRAMRYCGHGTEGASFPCIVSHDACSQIDVLWHADCFRQQVDRLRGSPQLASPDPFPTRQRVVLRSEKATTRSL
jgi:hypothetical protein